MNEKEVVLTKPQILLEMEQQLRNWESSADRKAVFLGCYAMMTHNMHDAVEAGEFNDGEWVRQLLLRFARYYFDALECYEKEADAARQVWRIAHDAAAESDITPLQLLLLGVNAHINYDLVLALDDVLAEEWPRLDPEARTKRHADYCHVNDIIARTIDAVQDAILNPAMPIMETVDTLMGRLDEMLISSLLTRWRDEVWQSALRVLEPPDGEQREAVRREVEVRVLDRADMLAIRDWRKLEFLLSHAM